jgi:putative FmdB family regulatory protein
MPIYEYKCGKGHKFEVMQRMTEDPIAVCETCGAPVAKVMHSPAVHFKGSGFYSTDYGSRKRSRELKEAADGKGKESSGDAGEKSSSSDSKSETSKPDSKPAKSTAAAAD